VARDYDTALLDSVAVRRRRLRDALVYGSLAIRRSYEENLGKAMASVAIAAVLGAGCVGWSFIRHQIATDPQPGSVVQTTPGR